MSTSRKRKFNGSGAQSHSTNFRSNITKSNLLAGDELVPVRAFDIFEPDKKQISVLDTYYWEALPSFTFSDKSNIIFELPASNTMWTSPELILNIKLKVQRKKQTTDDKGNITGSQWENITSSDKNFTLSMLPLHSCFSDIILYLNNEQVTSKHGLYPYLAYFQSYWLIGEEDRTFLEGTQCAYFDERNNLDDVSKGSGTEKKMLEPQNKRRKPFFDGDEGFLCGKILIPFCCQTKYLLPGVSIRLELVQTSSAFRAIDKPEGQECKVSITHASLCGKRKLANSELYVRSMRYLSLHNAQYSIDRFTICTAQIPAGSQLFSQNISLATTILPR